MLNTLCPSTKFVLYNFSVRHSSIAVPNLRSKVGAVCKRAIRLQIRGHRRATCSAGSGNYGYWLSAGRRMTRTYRPWRNGSRIITNEILFEPIGWCFGICFTATLHRLSRFLLFLVSVVSRLRPSRSFVSLRPSIILSLGDLRLSFVLSTIFNWVESSVV